MSARRSAELRIEVAALYALTVLGVFEILRGVVSFGVAGTAGRVADAPGVSHPFLVHLLVMLVHLGAALLALRDDVSFAALFALVGSMFAGGPISYAGSSPLDLGGFVAPVVFAAAYWVPYPWPGAAGAVARLLGAALLILGTVQALIPHSSLPLLSAFTFVASLCAMVPFASRAAIHRDRRAVGLAVSWLPIGLDTVAELIGFGRLAPSWFLHGCLIVGPLWVGYVYLTSTEGDSDAGEQRSGDPQA